MQAHGPKLSALEQKHARLHAGNSLVLQVSAWVCRDRNGYLLVPESLLFKVLGDSARAVFVLRPVCVCVWWKCPTSRLSEGFCVDSLKDHRCQR